MKAVFELNDHFMVIFMNKGTESREVTLNMRTLSCLYKILYHALSYVIFTMVLSPFYCWKKPKIQIIIYITSY